MTLARAKHDLGGLLHGTLEAINVAQRGVSPRIVSALVVGSAGTTTVTGPQLEAAFDLPSAWACFEVTTASGVASRGWDAACTGPTSPPQTGPTGATGASGTSGTTGTSDSGGTGAP
jgi:hypothetical protein